MTKNKVISKISLVSVLANIFEYRQIFFLQKALFVSIIQFNCMEFVLDFRLRFCSVVYFQKLLLPSDSNQFSLVLRLTVTEHGVAFWPEEDSSGDAEAEPTCAK